MKTKKKTTQEEKMPPGKEKAPKPQPGSSVPNRAGESEEPTKPEEHESDDEVLAPDGVPEPKKKPTPLF